MRWRWVPAIAVGIAVGGIGILWFLQGSNLVHLEPIACVGACEPLRGHHPGWQIAGAATGIAGAALVTLGARRLRT